MHEQLGEIENLIVIPYHQSDFIHHVYMVVKNTQMMKKACKRWANKSAHLCATEQQCRDHFNAYYEEIVNEDEQLQNGGIANNVVLQTTQNSLQEVKQQLEQVHATNVVINARLANMEAQTTQQLKENESLISGMTAMSMMNTTQESNIQAL